jgi:hypothetical protein
LTLRARFCAAHRTRRSWVARATIDRLDTGRGRKVATRDWISGLPATKSEIPTIFADLIYDEKTRR